MVFNILLNMSELINEQTNWRALYQVRRCGLSSRVELENSDTNSLNTSPCPVETKAAEEAVGRPASGSCPGYLAGCRASLTQ